MRTRQTGGSIINVAERKWERGTLSSPCSPRFLSLLLLRTVGNRNEPLKVHETQHSHVLKRQTQTQCHQWSFAKAEVWLEFCYTRQDCIRKKARRKERKDRNYLICHVLSKSLSDIMLRSFRRRKKKKEHRNMLVYFLASAWDINSKLVQFCAKRVAWRLRMNDCPCRKEQCSAPRLIRYLNSGDMRSSLWPNKTCLKVDAAPRRVHEARFKNSMQHLWE